MVRKTVPDDRSGTAETSFAEFRCCFQHDQISTFRRAETSSAREIRCLYADVLEIWRTDISDTVRCKECNFNLYSLRYDIAQHWCDMIVLVTAIPYEQRRSSPSGVVA